MTRLQGISEHQKPLQELPTISTQRLGVIIKKGDNFLLEMNTTPRYDNIATFLNTTLSNDMSQSFSLEELQEKALELIKTRTGYTHLSFIAVLQGEIEWSFHKPDKDYNEK